MSKMVASSDWRLRFVGGFRSMPLEMACGLDAIEKLEAT